MNLSTSTLEALIRFYNTNSASGLSGHEAVKRLEKYGPNSIPRAQPTPLMVLFIRQFQSPLIYILLAAAVLIAFLGDYRDALTVSAILLFNALVGTVQEGRANTLFESLQKYVTLDAVVVREGKNTIIPAENVTLGDIIIVQEGDKIPADARIIQAEDLKIDEALLTGESTPVVKKAVTLDRQVPVYDQVNMLFKGTTVLTGYAQALVVAIGQDTQIGQIGKASQTLETRMPLKRQLDKLSRWILVIIALFCCLLFVLGFVIGKPITELIATLSALFIAIIPEGLPLVFTVVLATGTYQLAKQYMLVKRLQAVEGLGRTDVIVVDKTGTLTRNELTVVQVFSEDKLYSVSGTGYLPEGHVFYNNNRVQVSDAKHETLIVCAQAAALLNRSSLTYNKALQAFQVKGEPLEAAFGVFARKLGITRENLEQEYRRVHDIPFDRTLWLHVAFYIKRNTQESICFVSGAPEKVLQHCTNDTEITHKAFKHMLDEGLRITALAYKNLGQVSLDTLQDFRAYFMEHIAGHLEFLGLVGMQDTVRPDVAPMVEKARQAGLEVVMATGDHKRTALSIARQTSIFQAGDEVLEGKQFNALSDEQLLSHLAKITVYARVSPQDKLRLIGLFHVQDKIVAMTGDGVNDVPALVAADLGIAMGMSGTEVAREAADLVLLDDSFGSIIHAIEQGRHIFYALRRVILYFFATNLSEVLLLLGVLTLNLPLPLLPVHILWINLVTDGFLDVGLALEPRERDLLNKSWLKRAQKAGLINTALLAKIVYLAIPMAVGSLIVFYRAYSQDLVRARTLTLVCLCIFQWFNAWNCRSETLSLLTLPLLSNKWLIAATVVTVTLQLMMLYISALQHIFYVVPLTLNDWLYCTAFAFFIIIWEEIRKYSASFLRVMSVHGRLNLTVK